MRQVQIRRKKTHTRTDDLDLRSPSGRTLPY
jgi:hypothetical protein